MVSIICKILTVWKFRNCWSYTCS